MLKQIDLEQVKITGGYFKEKQDMNKNVTIPATYQQFTKTGRFEALKLKWRKGEENQPHIFWDSDIAKWIEGAAYELMRERNANLEDLIDAAIEDIAVGQAPNGYFNSYYQVSEYANRFTKRENHELYCAGHLIEAAVAFKQATGKNKFLRIMCKYANYIYDEFINKQNQRPKDFITPGHQEIELALVKLFKETGENKYLELSKFFIDNRGKNKEEQSTFVWATANYAQEHAPIAEQDSAEGHAVRCLYMFAGAADIAREFSDDKLKEACERVFENIVNKKMYVTGGLGGNFNGEAFSRDYDLPNELAYTETCASIAMVFFCQRMFLLTGESKYFDIIELQIYNAILSGVSLHGDRFFYCNPLEVHPERRDYFANIRNGQFAPEYERPEYFGCSCCPPNVIRLIASLGQYMYHVGEENNSIYINLYNTSEFNYNGVKITQETDYPRSGKVIINVETDKPVKILARMPNWTKSVNIELIGEGASYERIVDYMCVNVVNSAELTLDFDMQIVEIYANPKLHECAGRIAVKRGPIVYCAESINNCENLKSVKILGNYNCEDGEIDGNKIMKINCDSDVVVGDDAPVVPNVTNESGRTRASVPTENDLLYSRKPFEREQKKLELIPYAAWANRGKSEMLVWLLK